MYNHTLLHTTKTYIILTVTLKGVAAVAVGSIVGGALSGAEPGMLRLRPVLSGGESVRQWDKERFFLLFTNKLIVPYTNVSALL